MDSWLITYLTEGGIILVLVPFLMYFYEDESPKCTCASLRFDLIVFAVRSNAFRCLRMGLLMHRRVPGDYVRVFGLHRYSGHDFVCTAHPRCNSGAVWLRYRGMPFSFPLFLCVVYCSSSAWLVVS